jgi:hypothetical protein
MVNRWKLRFFQKSSQKQWERNQSVKGGLVTVGCHAISYIESSAEAVHVKLKLSD